MKEANPTNYLTELQRNLTSEMQKSGNTGMLDSKWEARLKEVPFLKQNVVEANLNNFRSLNTVCDFLEANQNRDPIKFIESCLDAIRFDIVDPPFGLFQNTTNLEKTEYGQSIYVLYHKIPEIFHASTTLCAILELDKTNFQTNLDLLTRTYETIRKSNIVDQIMNLSTEERSILDQLKSGKSSDEIIKDLYRAKANK